MEKEKFDKFAFAFQLLNVIQSAEAKNRTSTMHIKNVKRSSKAHIRTSKRQEDEIFINLGRRFVTFFLPLPSHTHKL